MEYTTTPQNNLNPMVVRWVLMNPWRAFVQLATRIQDLTEDIDHMANRFAAISDDLSVSETSEAINDYCGLLRRKRLLCNLRSRMFDNTRPHHLESDWPLCQSDIDLFRLAKNASDACRREF